MAGGRWSKIAALAIALVLVWVAPGSAQVETLPEGYAAFVLQGTHGYSILVRAHPDEGSQDEGVDLTVWRKGSAAFYDVPAEVTATKIDARLGGAGRIAVEFHPRGEPRIAHIKCNRRAALRYQPGVWAGMIEFKGEEGFTRVKTRFAKQVAWPLLLIACPFVSEPEEEEAGLPGARLAAQSGSRSHGISLVAITNRPGGRLKLSTSLDEQRGELHVSRWVHGFFPAEGFSFESNLRTATLQPPGPFSGAAVYRRYEEPRERWTGNLTVDFPGRSNVSITGARFHTSFVHARYTREVRYDERPASR
jgi:hypothetical protein